MLRTCVVLFAGALTTLGADDAWKKVREVKSGSELRILKRGVSQPLLAKMDEATERSLIVVMRDRQLAIPRDEIERIDARPAQANRIRRESKNTTVYNDTPTSAALARARPAGSTTRSSTSLTFQPRAEFETVYRRGASTVGAQK